MRVSLLAPSRGRPESLERMVQSAFKTAAEPVEVLCYWDEDDDSNYPMIEGVTYVRGPRLVLSEAWNACSEYAQGDIMGHLGDDVIFHTPHWDQLVVNRFDIFADKIAFVFGKDGNEHDRLKVFGTHGFIHRRWVDAVGYFVPPYFSSDHNDTWLNDVAHIINRHVYEPEIYMEHMHPALGKGDWDQTHKDRLERAKKDKPGELYYSAEMIRRRMLDANKLLEVME